MWPSGASWGGAMSGLYGSAGDEHRSQPSGHTVEAVIAFKIVSSHQLDEVKLVSLVADHLGLRAQRLHIMALTRSRDDGAGWRYAGDARVLPPSL